MKGFNNKEAADSGRKPPPLLLRDSGQVALRYSFQYLFRSR